MLPSRSGIFSEARSKLIKTFSCVFFPNLYYTFITYDAPKSNRQPAKSNEQRAKNNEQRAKSNEQRAINNKQRRTSKKFHLFFRKGVLRYFANFTWKHLYQSLFFNKVAGLGPATLLKKENLAQVFSCEFWEISKNTFFYRTPPVAASALSCSFHWWNSFYQVLS